MVLYFSNFSSVLIYGQHSATLQYLHCRCNGDISVLYSTILCILLLMPHTRWEEKCQPWLPGALVVDVMYHMMVLSLQEDEPTCNYASKCVVDLGAPLKMMAVWYGFNFQLQWCCMYQCSIDLWCIRARLQYFQCWHAGDTTVLN